MNLVASGLGMPKHSRAGEPVMNDQCGEGISLCDKSELDRTSRLKSNEVRRWPAHCWWSSLRVNMRSLLHYTSARCTSVRRTQRKSRKPSDLSNNHGVSHLFQLAAHNHQSFDRLYYFRQRLRNYIRQTVEAN